MKQLFLLVCLFLVSCKPVSSIDSVKYVPNSNLSEIALTLNFSKSVTSTLLSDLTTDYGLFFIRPWSKKTPFSVGMIFNLNIFLNPEYVSLPRTDMTPNGLPLGIPYPVATLHGSEMLSAYIDVDHYAWLGFAFLFLNDSSFPSGSSVLRVFSRDQYGSPKVFCHTFGPSGDVHGGIVFMADVRHLIETYGAEEATLKSEKSVSVIGQPISIDKLYRSELRLIDSLNQR